MAHGLRLARDLALLDAVDVKPREAFAGELWRVCREGRDPLQGGPSLSRWCRGEFDVLYTSLERNGAIAEIHSLLSMQPVFPSRIAFRVHRLRVETETTLRFADLAALAELGVDVGNYRGRDYAQTQNVADAAYFLGFDGLIAPSARWDCLNAMLFSDRIGHDRLTVEESDVAVIDWSRWRAEHRGSAT